MIKSITLIALTFAFLPLINAQITNSNLNYLNDGQDSFTRNFDPETPTNNENLSTLVSGTPSSPLVRRSYIRFDLSSIPDNAIIVNANLSLYRTSHSTSPSTVINRISEEWEESELTWENAPDVELSDEITIIPTYNNSRHSFDVTDQLQYLVNYKHLNFGWRLRSEIEEVDEIECPEGVDAPCFSTNGTDYSSFNREYIDERPELNISWVLPIEISLNQITNADTPSINNGSISVNATGGDGSYSYQWINGATGSYITGATNSTVEDLFPGWYGVQVTDDLGNVSYLAFVVGAKCGEVIVDFQPDARFIDDTHVFDQSLENNNYSQSSSLKTSRSYFSPSWHSSETLLKFNVVLPDDLNLNYADLTLKGNGNHNSSNGNDATFSMLIEDWKEDIVTWRIKPNSGSVLYNSPSTVTPNENLELDLSSYFLDVQQGSINNFGFRYHLNSSGSLERERQYYSSNDANSSNRPKMRFSLSGCPYQILVKSDNPGTSSNEQFQFSGAQGEYDVHARNISTNNVEVFKGLVNQQTITFDEGAGTYELKVYPVGSNPFHRIRFNNGGDKNKLLEIQKWGNVEWSSMDRAYFGCSNLDVTATDIPDFTGMNNMYMCFRLCSNLTGNSSFNSWDVSNVTNFSWMFAQGNVFNQNIGNWNVGSGLNFSYMFYFNNAFNNGGSTSINSWNVFSATNMAGMFRSTPFNQPLNNWNLSNATNLSQMFLQASTFNQNIGSWDMSNVSNITNMFQNALAFNNGGSNDINSWNVSNISGFFGVFRGASSFNQDLSSWHVSSATNMGYMFQNATSYSHSLENWDISNVTQMQYMLDNTALSTAAYDATLISWNSGVVQLGVSLGAIGLTYCAADLDRSNLINADSWTISGDSYISSCQLDDYAVPERELNATFYETHDGVLHVQHWESYSPDNFTYRIYDNTSTDISNGSALTTTPVEHGNNLLTYDFGSGGQCLPTGYYILEIEDQKGNIRKLRFHHISTAC